MIRAAVDYAIEGKLAAKQGALREANYASKKRFGDEFHKWAKHLKVLPNVVYKTRTMADGFLRGARVFRDSSKAAFAASGAGDKYGRGVLKKAVRGKGIRAEKASAAERSQRVLSYMRAGGRGSGAEHLHFLDRGTKERKTKSGASRGMIKALNFLDRGIDLGAKGAETAIGHYVRANNDRLMDEVNQIARHVVT